eukprot:1622490-Amphidinium_carterae.6
MATLAIPLLCNGSKSSCRSLEHSQVRWVDSLSKNCTLTENVCLFWGSSGNSLRHHVASTRLFQTPQLMLCTSRPKCCKWSGLDLVSEQVLWKHVLTIITWKIDQGTPAMWSYTSCILTCLVNKLTS